MRRSYYYNCNCNCLFDVDIDGHIDTIALRSMLRYSYVAPRWIVFKAIALLRRRSISHGHEDGRVKRFDKPDRGTMAGWRREHEELDGRLASRRLHASLATRDNQKGTQLARYIRDTSVSRIIHFIEWINSDRCNSIFSTFFQSFLRKSEPLRW